MTLNPQELAESVAKEVRSESDCDRLDDAFQQLHALGIVARQNFTCCQTCGQAKIASEIRAFQASGRSVTGYCFFDEQETEAAIAGHGLYLTFGAVGEGSLPEQIGATVVAAMSSSGLTAEWDGSAATRVRVRLAWEKRFGLSGS